MESFVRHILSFRKSRNVTQKEVATALGLNVRSYQRYERGVVEPGLDVIVRMADYYAVSMDRMIGRTNPENQ